jgi:hypothetical protein
MSHIQDDKDGFKVSVYWWYLLMSRCLIQEKCHVLVIL